MSESKTEDLPREASSGPIFHPDWGTHAYVSYKRNTSGLDALLAMVFPLLTESEKSEKYLTARLLQVENDHEPWAIDVRHTMLSWQVAMRVSAVEVYLQDALTFLAVYDPEFIRKRGSKQEWTYDDVRSASDNEEALWTFCGRWARSFIGDGGPMRWSKALKGGGLGKYSEKQVLELEGMWGYRHMRVHNGGRLNRDFMKRHSSLAEHLATEGLQLGDLQAWAATADTFVAEAESGIAGRLRAKLGLELITMREKVEFQRQMARWSTRHERINNKEKPEEAAERVQRATQEAEEQFALMRELFDEPAKQETATPEKELSGTPT